MKFRGLELEPYVSNVHGSEHVCVVYHCLEGLSDSEWRAPIVIDGFSFCNKHGTEALAWRERERNTHVQTEQ